MNFSMIQGDSLDIFFVFRKNGVPMSLDGFSISFVCKLFFQDVSNVFLKEIGSGIVVTDVAGGLFTVSIYPEDTQSLVIPHSNVNTVVAVNVKKGLYISHTTTGVLTVNAG